MAGIKGKGYSEGLREYKEIENNQKEV